MPTIRYRTRGRIVSGTFELTNWQVWALLSAGPQRGWLLAHWPEDDPDPWAEAWHHHGERLLAGWIEESPGSRPWPWWVFEHGQERPIVNPGILTPEGERHVRREYTYFGILHTSILGPCGGELVPWQEPEAEYLHRNDLLTDAERQHLEI